MNARKTFTLTLVCAALITGSASAATVSRTAVDKSVPSAITDGYYTIGSLSSQEQVAYNFVNQERIAAGLAPLTLDTTLCAFARVKSQDMLENRYFAHESPTYGNVRTMLKNGGYAFKGAGENIARYATVEKAHAALMSSSGHRRNILSSAWTKVGIGIALDKNGFVYLTQIFAR